MTLVDQLPYRRRLARFNLAEYDARPVVAA